MKAIQLHILFLWLFAYCHTIHGQYVADLVYSRTITESDGLPSLHINDIYHDSDGFTWLATPKGLFRYDGYRFKPYTSDEYSLSANWASFLAQDSDGMLWIGRSTNMYQGSEFHSIDIFDGRTGKAIPLQQYLKNNIPFSITDVRYMHADNSHTVWLMLVDGNIYRYKGNKLQQFYKGDSKSYTETKVINLKSGGLAIGYGYKTIIIDSTGREVFSKKHSLNGNTCMLLEEIDGQIYYISESIEAGGIVDAGMLSLTDFSHKPLNIDSLKRIRQNYANANIATRGIATVDSELGMMFHGTRWTRGKPMWMLFNDKLHAVKLEKKRFKQHLNTPTKAINAARRITFDPTIQCIVVGGVFGLFSIDNRGEVQKQIITPPPHGNDKDALSRLDFSEVYVDDQHNYWLGAGNPTYKIIKVNTEGKLLAQIAIDKFSHTSIVTIWQILQKNSHEYFIATSTGLYELNSTTNAVIPVACNDFDAVKGQSIFHVVKQKKDKGYWVASSVGLFKLDADRGIVAQWHTKGQNPLPHNTLTHLYEEPDGSLWLTSKGGGLIWFNPETGESKQFTQKHGLTDNTLYAVYPDDYGHLWMSSDHGIMRFNKKTHAVASFSEDDGLIHHEFNTVSHYQHTDGTIYFGGFDGIVSFHPKDFIGIEEKTPIGLSTLLIQSQETGTFNDATHEYWESGEIVLDPSDFGFQIQFAYFDPINAHKASFQYMIEGIDQEWQSLQEKPELRINALPYGTYKLVVRAQHRSGVFSDELHIPIQVLRPFYLQWWFIALLALLLAFGIWAAVRYRITRLKMRQRLLEIEVYERTKELQRDKLLIERQAEELKTLDQMKSRFFANISHELRTPLTLMMGPLERIAGKKEVAPAIASELGMMTRNTERLLKLVNNILDLSKLDAQKLALRTKAVNLKAMLRRIADGFESEARHQGIAYTLDLDLPESHWVEADAEKLEDILNNLLANALKFTPKGGEIYVGAKRIAQGQVQLLVRDTGKGISEEDLPHIFDRYFQTKSKDAPMQGGTGIGLAFAKELAELMQGSLTVQSLLGKGATFCLTLPLPETEEPAVQAVPEEHSAVASITEQWQQPAPASSEKPLAVIAEDTPDLRHYIESILAPHFQLAAFSNGAEAWAFLQASGQQASLLVSDVMMPEMDGFELLQRVKGHAGLQLLPVVMLTARIGENDRLHALRLGVDDYITKPFSSQELLARAINLAKRFHLRQEAIKEAEDISKEEDGAEAPLPEALQAWLKALEEQALLFLKRGQLSVANVADAMAMSERQLQRRMKESLGMGPKDYFLEIQMQLARERLEAGDVTTVAVLAESLGFKNAHYFSQRFEQRFGKKPSAYLH